MTIRLLLLSDLHLEFADLVLDEGLEYDVALLAGDILCPGSSVARWVRATPTLRRAKAVLMVSGNHEYYDRVLQQEATAMHAAARRSRHPPMHLLDCTQVVIDGVRFLGCTLWTDFELRIDTADGAVSDRVRGMAAVTRAMADYRLVGWLDDPAAQEAAVPRCMTPQDTLRLHFAQRHWLEQALAQRFDEPIRPDFDSSK